jgi:hypothetical protein
VIARTVDVSVAFMHAPAEENQFVQPPPEWEAPAGMEGAVWRLKKALNGTRAAPRSWQQHLADVLKQEGFRQGTADSQVFHNKETEVSLIAHVDDFLLVGDETKVA